MRLVEDTLDTDLDDFLARPLFCFLATTDDDEPRVSPLWFLWEDEAFWIVADTDKTYPDRIRRNPSVALAVVDFDASTGTVQHVGVRGRATVEPHDPARAKRLLRRYLGPDEEQWDQSRFPDPATWDDRMAFVRVESETVVARDQSYVPSGT